MKRVIANSLLLITLIVGWATFVEVAGLSHIFTFVGALLGWAWAEHCEDTD